MHFNYTKYTKYIPIVLQLQNTNYFCQGHKYKYKILLMYFRYSISITCISITPTLVLRIRPHASRVLSLTRFGHRLYAGCPTLAPPPAANCVSVLVRPSRMNGISIMPAGFTHMLFISAVVFSRVLDK